MEASAFLVNSATNKKELSLYDDVSLLGILPSLTDKRCSRHQAEITFRNETQDGLLYVVGPTPVAVKKGSSKPKVIDVNENTTLAHGDIIMLIPDIDTQFEFQTIKGQENATKKIKREKSNSFSNLVINNDDAEDSDGKKRKRDDNSDSDTVKKSGKKKHPCKYGKQCFRKNIDHLQKFSHGSDAESDNSSNEKPIKKEPKDETTTTSKSSKLKIIDDSPVKNPFLQASDSEEEEEKKPVIKKEKVSNKNNIKNMTNINNGNGGDDDDDDYAFMNRAKKMKVEKEEEEEEDSKDKKGKGKVKKEEEDEEEEGEGEDGEKVKPLHVMAEGEEISIQGDSGTDHKLKYIGGVYSCTCHAWRNQSLPISNRTCKHLRTYLGDEYEQYRLKRNLAATLPAKSAGGNKKQIPDLLLAHKWEPHIDPTGWWVSEKLDGVRAYWDGTTFLSRVGNVFHAPEWFTKLLPNTPLDGELWCGRSKFSLTVSIAKSVDAGGRWKELTYQVFDAPAMKEKYEDRYDYMKKLIKDINSPYIQLVKAKKVADVDFLKTELKKIEDLGGEGLMLRKPLSLYMGGRSTTLLKVKTFMDDEAIVKDYEPGKGKHKGKVGSLMCELANGIKFNVGTGLSDAERANPPPVGSVITFRCQELTDAGVPRFPAYVGIRTDVKWPPKKKS